MIDTGSYYTWVSGIKNNNSNHNYYKLKENDKNELIEKNIDGTFNGGDNLVFSLYNFNFTFYENININNIPIGLSNYESELFSNINIDGIIGLGGFFGNETVINNNINNIITHFMVEQKIIEYNMFSLYINTTNTGYNMLNMYGGEIIFGNYNKKYKNKIKWYNIYNKDNIYYFWNLFLNEISINGYKNIVDDKILIDSGTSDIVFNKKICDKIHKQINGKYQRYIIDNYNDLKNISFNINGDEYILEPNDYTFILNKIIYSKIIINNNDNKVLGLPFLQKYYSIYDFENKKIGIAKNI